ncbi:MAG TPA: OB-fold nucleic acid binding domain-containing protein, partial [Clostridia bacterium]|nr:OB-fold nucleic acid binding domain-containing protein [Clostridia bacterium]
YISGHPLDGYMDLLKSVKCNQTMDIPEMREQQQVALCGLVSTKKQISTRKGDLMAFVTLEDLTGSVELIVFPEVYGKYQVLLEKEEGIFVRGHISNSGEDAKIIARDIFNLKSMARELYLRFNDADPVLLAQIQQILRKYKGMSPLYLYFKAEDKMLRAGNEFWVNLNSPLVSDLGGILGLDNVKILNRGD